MRAPTASPTSTASTQGIPVSRMSRATTIPTAAATDPTERSMCPAMMTRTIPMAMTRMYELPLKMLMTFSGLRTRPPVMIWKSTMSATSAKIMPN